MSSHSTEPFLIGGVLVLTAAAGFLLLRKSSGAWSQKSEKIISGFLGVFLLMGGSVKFVEPFTSMFAKQIALSELPFPVLSKWAGQLGEISVGILFLALLFMGKRLVPLIADRAFYFANSIVVIIMTVAVYVHLHPNVPAEVLPLGEKPPILTLIIMSLAFTNMVLRHMTSRQERHFAVAVHQSF